MSNDLTAQAPTLSSTLGAIFFGVISSCILFGVSTLQVYYYYHYYPHDTLLQKSSVAVLGALDTLHLALTIFSSYHYGVVNFGIQQSLGEVLWSIKLLVAINVVIILLVQSLYAYRVWLLGGYHHGVLGYLVAAVVLGGFAIGMVLAYETYTVDNWSETGDIAWAVESSFAASTLIDVVISIAMCFYLRKSKGRESALNSRISTLMQYTLSCGVFTSACSIACLFTFILMPNNLVFLALSFLLTRCAFIPLDHAGLLTLEFLYFRESVYVNSFMAMMNARERVRRRHDDSTLVLSNHISSALPPRVPQRPTSDIENQQDKYDWIDVHVPTLKATGPAHLPHMNGPTIFESHGKAEYAYTRNW
ncbi:hypothetical protein C8F04DRAFT_1402413 [Mycena alexandri]|uniref:DUF6534 domain-containing protein n=1 Tax=Mycena alexandri TaxID=1745969 RepID=A0AAD6S750_9AGAR|nr:hypothetical protein C8F04DRAFT_1402413 [Mycena alexandri]